MKKITLILHSKLNLKLKSAYVCKNFSEKSSNEWLARQKKDPFVKKSKFVSPNI
jgi:hypothetical protein